MIVVTGGTGKLGRAIVEQLLKRTPATSLGVSTRDPEQARAFITAGVRVRKAGYDDPEAMRRAFEGATQVLLISSNAAAFGKDPIAHHENAIAAARAAGVKRIVYTSQISASPTSAFAPGLDHAKTEALLRDAGLAFTSLRNGFYASHALGVIANALERGELVAPEDGPYSWVAHADLAEAAAAVLLDEGRFDGPTPPLTGSEAIDFAGLAALATELGGRTIRRVVVSDDEYVARMTAAGMPAGAARFALGMFAAARRGEFAAVDPTLERLVGHRPVTLRALLEA